VGCRLHLREDRGDIILCQALRRRRLCIGKREGGGRDVHLETRRSLLLPLETLLGEEKGGIDVATTPLPAVVLCSQPCGLNDHFFRQRRIGGLGSAKMLRDDASVTRDGLPVVGLKSGVREAKGGEETSWRAGFSRAAAQNSRKFCIAGKKFNFLRRGRSQRLS
jgi:hypothetical protein